MTAAWNFTACSCTWDRYSLKCSRPQHKVWALRDRPDPRLPLIMSAPCPDTVPAWLEEEAS